MTLRTRLAALTALILVVGVAIVGIVVSQMTRDALIDPINTRLSRLAQELQYVERGTNGGPGPRGGAGFDPGPTDATRPEGRDTALLRFVDGDLETAFPSGFDSDPDQLPNVTASIADHLQPGQWKLTNLSSADGSLDFRAAIIVSDTSSRNSPMLGTTAERVVLVFARPLDAVDAAVDRLRLIVLAVGLSVLAVGASLIWVIVRKSLRPVEETIATAARIGDGDLSLRVPEPDHPEELRSLGSSINSMLADIERSQQSETHARSALTQFVADASHELRTPIAAISGHAELISAGGLDADGVDRSVERIASESRRMQRLVDDLLTLASHDTGHRRPHRRVNLSDIVSDAVEDGRAIDSSRTYATDIEPGIRVLGDEAQLQQVVANLLANIRAHTPAGTAAFIRLTHVASKDAETANPANPADAEGREVTVIVSDDGPGISQEQRSRLFERFFRAGSNPAHTGGAGLGLAIVAAIMDEHGGSVSLDDDSATTSFVLRFPSPIDSVDSTSAMMSGHDNR